MSEDWTGKRRAERVSVNLRAHIEFADKRPPQDVTVLDISRAGAKLQVPDPAVSLPEEFLLVVPGRALAAFSQLRWRDGGLAGVEFVNIIDNQPAHTGLRQAGGPSQKAVPAPAAAVAAALAPIVQRLDAMDQHLEHLEKDLRRLSALAHAAASPVQTMTVPDHDHPDGTRIMQAMREEIDALRTRLDEQDAALTAATKTAASPAIAAVHHQADTLVLKQEIDALRVHMQQQMAVLERTMQQNQSPPVPTHHHDTGQAALSSTAASPAPSDQTDLHREVRELRAIMEGLVMTIAVRFSSAGQHAA